MRIYLARIMIRAYLRRAWKVGRAYYFATIIIMLVVMAFTIAFMVYGVSSATPESVHGVNLPPNLAVIFTKYMLTLFVSTLIAMFVSMLSSIIVLGTIQADMQNGVFEILFGNGVSDGELIRALFIVGFSAFAVFFVIAEVLVMAMFIVTHVSLPYVLIIDIILVPLSTGLFTTGLSVFVGLTKPKYFRISTGIGSTRNLAFTVVALPSLVILMITIIASLSIIGVSSIINPIMALQSLGNALIIASVVMLTPTPLFIIMTHVDRVGLVSKGVV